MAQIEFITKQNLQGFKLDMLTEIRILFKPKEPDSRQWLRSRDNDIGKQRKIIELAYCLVSLVIG